MDEKKIIYKSIDEQLAEEEAKERAAATSKQNLKADAKSTGKAVARTSTGVKRGRKKLRLKKSARRTIGSLLLATSLVVGVIPVGGVSADSSGVYKGNDSTAPAIDAIDDNTEDDTKVDVPSAGETIGGFTIKIDKWDSSGNPLPSLEFGDKSFFAVDS